MRACAYACRRSPSSSGSSGRIGAGLRSAVIRPSTACHSRQDDDRVALLDGRRALLEIPHVLVIHVDVHEPIERALIGEQLRAQRGMGGSQAFEHLADRRAANLDRLHPACGGAEDRRDSNGAHARAPRTNSPSYVDDGTGSGWPASRAATACSEQTGQAGSRRKRSSVNDASSASKSNRRPASESPIRSRILIASLVCSRPMIPGTTPSTPATEQPGASSGGGGAGERQR